MASRRPRRAPAPVLALAQASRSVPDRNEYREPMGSLGAEWDRRGQIASILRQLEQAIFTEAALLVDTMGRDDRIAGVKGARIDGMLGAPLVWTPSDAKSTKRTQAITDEAEEAWPRMAPRAELVALLESALMVGVGVAEIIWQTGATRWAPRLKWWHPQFLGWDWTERRYYVMPESGAQVWLPRTDAEPQSDGKWLVFTPFGFSYAWMRGLMRPLAMLYLRRQWNQRDTARFNEVYGQLIRKAITPAQASDADKNRFSRSIRRMNAETTVECPEGFDLKIEGAGTTSAAMFLADTNYLDASIGAVFLGTGATGEKVGGLGDAQASGDESRTREKQRADAALYDVLRNQLLSWWALYNHGSADLAPYVEPQLDPPESVEAKAQPLATLATALDVLARYGADVDALLEDAAVPMRARSERAPTATAEPADATPAEATQPTAATSEPEVKFELTPTAQASIVKVNQALDKLGFPPLMRPDGTRDPEGDLTIAEYQARHSGTIADAAAAQAGKPPVSETPPAAPAVEPTAPLSTVSLAAPARVEDTLDKQGDYVADLAAEATADAREAMAADLADIMDAIRTADSPEALRASLRKLYAAMKPGALAKVTERALLMAEMAGRVDLLAGV